MKLRHLLLTVAAFALAACDQSAKQEAAKLAEERAALDRDKADLAAQKAAAQQAANDQERARLESERAALELEKAKLSNNREALAAAEHAAQLAAEHERRLAAERNAADQAAARQAAEVRELEAKMTAGQAHAGQTADFFYDALDPYGEWVQTDRYGYAFRPSAAHDARWRPYTAGDWVFTEYGWTWRWEEPFGWATYHYGRWARAPRLGWVWIPGTEWGPAWVSWRRGGEYVGWAPLPPDAWSSSGFNAGVDSYYDIGPGLYAFLHVADFGEASYRGRFVAPEQNVTIINQTVNVTKVTYQKVQNNVTVVNNGPDITVINEASRRPVQRLAVQRLTVGAPQPAKVVGNVLQIAAPVFKNVQPGAKPKAVKGELKAAELDHGWREAKGDEPRFREEAKQAARRAEENERAPVKAIEEPVPVAPALKPQRLPVVAPEPARVLAPGTPIPRLAPTTVVPAPPLRVAATPEPAEPATPPVRKRPPVATPAPVRPVATPAPAEPRAAATPKLRAPKVEGVPLTPIPRGLPGNPPLKPARKPVPGAPPAAATPKPGELPPGAPLR